MNDSMRVQEVDAIQQFFWQSLKTSEKNFFAFNYEITVLRRRMTRDLQKQNPVWKQSVKGNCKREKETITMRELSYLNLMRWNESRRGQMWNVVGQVAL